MPDIFVVPQNSSQEPLPIKMVSNEVDTPGGKPNTPSQTSLKPPLSPQKNYMPAFATFCQNPQNISFVDLQEDEEIVLFLRADFITNVPWIVISFLLVFAPPLVFLLFQLNPLTTFSLSPQFEAILTSFYYLVVAGYALGNFINWFYNIGLVTTKRVIDLDVSYIIYKNVAASTIPSIQNVDYTQKGLIQTFFDFGDVLVQTEAHETNIEFGAVPRPAKIVEIIIQLKQGTQKNE